MCVVGHCLPTYVFIGKLSAWVIIAMMRGVMGIIVDASHAPKLRHYNYYVSHASLTTFCIMCIAFSIALLH